MRKGSERTVHASYILLIVLFIYSSLVGCEKPVWKNNLDSPGHLGLAVVDALNRKDIEQLDRLRVQREAYLDWIWPAFPASRPPNNFPGDFAWDRFDVTERRWRKAGIEDSRLSSC